MNETWRKKLQAAGFKTSEEPWSPAPRERAPDERIDRIGDAVKKAMFGP